MGGRASRQSMQAVETGGRPEKWRDTPCAGVLACVRRHARRHARAHTCMDKYAYMSLRMCVYVEHSARDIVRE